MKREEGCAIKCLNKEKYKSMHSEPAQLYDSQTIERLDWPATEQAQYAKKYLDPLIKKGIKPHIANVDAQMYALKIGSFVFPVIVAEEGSKNSYIFSPYEHYISYGKESIGLIDNRFVASFADSFLNLLGKVVRYGKIDSVIYVNHWLFSTDLYPIGFTDEHIAAIVLLLKEKFPRHAIIFRSTNELTTPDVQKMLRNNGFQLVASRHIHATDAKNEEIFKTRIIKSDLKLWRESPFQVLDESQISSNDCLELLKLYNKLYIEQHSTRNPQYTLPFIQHLFDQKLLHFKILKLGDAYKGVAGYYLCDGIMMCPFFGYDKQDPQQSAIYRMLSTALLLEAKEREAIFHQSAGASFYKSVRRAKGSLEFMAVYNRHLPLKQKLSWSLLKTFINTLAPRYMKNY